MSPQKLILCATVPQDLPSFVASNAAMAAAREESGILLVEAETCMVANAPPMETYHVCSEQFKEELNTEQRKDCHPLPPPPLPRFRSRPPRVGRDDGLLDGENAAQIGMQVLETVVTYPKRETHASADQVP